MSDGPHVAALCGSLSDDSRTRVALERALVGASDAGASTEMIDLREYHLPQYGLDGKNAGDAPELRAALDGADAILLGTPIYHGSYASPLKAALDYSGRDEFRDKTVGLVAVAGGRFPSKGLEHLRNVSRHINAWVLPTEVGIPNGGDAIDGGEVVDEAVADRLERLGGDAARFAGIDELPELRGPRRSN